MRNHADIVARVKADRFEHGLDGMLDFCLRVIAAVKKGNKETPGELIGLRTSIAGGESTTTYHGVLVRTNRLCYPDGQVVKILGDSGPTEASANTPQWNLGEVDPSAYVAVDGPIVLPPPVIDPPPVDPPPMTEYVSLLAAVDALRREVVTMKLAVQLLVERPDPRIAFPTYTTNKLPYFGVVTLTPPKP